MAVVSHWNWRAARKEIFRFAQSRDLVVLDLKRKFFTYGPFTDADREANLCEVAEARVRDAEGYGKAWFLVQDLGWIRRKFVVRFVWNDAYEAEKRG